MTISPATLLIALTGLLSIGCDQASPSADGPLNPDTVGIETASASILTDGGCSCRDNSYEPSISVIAMLQGDREGTLEVTLLSATTFPAESPGDRVALGVPTVTHSVAVGTEVGAPASWTLAYPRERWPHVDPGLGNFAGPSEGWDDAAWIMELTIEVVDPSTAEVRELSITTEPFSIDTGALG